MQQEISESRALEVMMEDIVRESNIKHLFHSIPSYNGGQPLGLFDNQKDALMSLSFNLGGSGLNKRKLTSKINDHLHRADNILKTLHQTGGNDASEAFNELNCMNAWDEFASFRLADGVPNNGIMKRRLAELMIFSGVVFDPESSYTPTNQLRALANGEYSPELPDTDENWNALSFQLKSDAVRIFNMYNNM